MKTAMEKFKREMVVYTIVASMMLATIGFLGVMFRVMLPSQETQVASAATVQPNPLVIDMSDPDRPGTVVNGGTKLTNLSEWYDYQGSPIAAVGAHGGFSVFGDNISTYPGGEVYKPSNRLHQDGGVTIGSNGPTLYGGTNAPTLDTCRKVDGRPLCVRGDYYFRSGRPATIQSRIYIFNNGAWVGIL